MFRVALRHLLKPGWQGGATPCPPSHLRFCPLLPPLFALTYFHSVLLERRKFRTLGLNIPYDFNDTDFGVSDDLLK